MEPAIFYKKRIDDLQKQLKKLQKKKSAFGWLRFGSIAAIQSCENCLRLPIAIGTAKKKVGLFCSCFFPTNNAKINM
jgi:hypothetical protein